MLLFMNEWVGEKNDSYLKDKSNGTHWNGKEREKGWRQQIKAIETAEVRGTLFLPIDQREGKTSREEWGHEVPPELCHRAKETAGFCLPCEGIWKNEHKAGTTGLALEHRCDTSSSSHCEQGVSVESPRPHSSPRWHSPGSLSWLHHPGCCSLLALPPLK